MSVSHLVPKDGRLDFYNLVTGHEMVRSSPEQRTRSNPSQNRPRGLLGHGASASASASAIGSTNARAVSGPQRTGHRDNRFHSRAARTLFLQEAGLDASSITREDDAFARMTPDITSRRFTTLFGGDSYHERPMSTQKNILCVNMGAQPFAPHSPGESGLVFVYSDVAVMEDTCETFHLFSNMNPKFSRSTPQIRYLGTYTKVPIIHTTVERQEWLSLPTRVSRIFHRFSPTPTCHVGF